MNYRVVTIAGAADDNSEQVVRIDGVSRAISTIELEHSLVHVGKSFEVSKENETMGDNASMLLAFRTPASPIKIHMMVEFKSKAESHIQIEENSSWTANTGSPLYVFNKCRFKNITTELLENSSATEFASTGYISLNPSNVIPGTILPKRYTFGTKQQGVNGGRSTRETILKYDTNYSVRLKADAGSNAGWLSLDWYEIE